MNRLHILRVSETVKTEYGVYATSEDEAKRKFRQGEGICFWQRTKLGPRELALIEQVEAETYTLPNPSDEEKAG